MLLRMQIANEENYGTLDTNTSKKKVMSHAPTRMYCESSAKMEIPPLSL